MEDVIAALQRGSADRVPSLAASLAPVLRLLQEQADRIGRLEEIVAAQPDAAEAALRARMEEQEAEDARAERLRRQLLQVQDSVATLEAQHAVLAAHSKQQQAAAAAAAQRVLALEAQLFNRSGGADGNDAAWRVPPLEQEQGPGSGMQGGGGGGGGGGLVERVGRLEDLIPQSEKEAKQREEEVRASLAGKLRRLEARVAEQLDSIREDTKQAITLTATAMRRDSDAALGSRVAEAEARGAQRVEALSAAVDGRIMQSVARSAAAQSDELERRVTAVHESGDARLRELAGRVDGLEVSKADAASLTACAAQLSEAFEEASAALSGASAAAADALQSEVGDLRREVAGLSTSKADADALASTARRLQRRTDACAEQAAAVAQRVEELEQHAAAVPQALDGVRLEVAELRGGVEGLQLTAKGLHSASCAAAGALERHGRALESLNARCASVAQRADTLRRDVFGAGGPQGAGPITEGDGDWEGEPGAAAVAGAPLAARVARAEAAWRRTAGELGGKAEEAGLRRALLRIDQLQEQVASNTEGVASLTNATFKRVDEHATAIQRLAAAISSAEERPTSRDVKQWVAEGLARAEASWQAEAQDLRGQQQEAAAQLQDASACAQAGMARSNQAIEQLEALRASSAEERRRGDEGLQRLQGKLGALAAQVAQGERSLGLAARQQVAELVAEAMQERLADHLKLHVTDLGARLGSAEAKLRVVSSQQAAAGKEAAVQARLLEKHCGLLSSLEKTLVELGSTCSAATKKLGGRWEAARKLSAERQDALASALERQAAAVEALSEGLGCAAAIAAGGGGAEAVRAAVAAAARRAAGERVDAFARERLREDDARWQAWLEKCAAALEQRVTKDELAQRLDAARRAADASARRAAADAAADAAGAAAAAAAGPLEDKVSSLEAAAASAAAAARRAQQEIGRDLGAVLEALATKADAAAVERALGQLRREADERAAVAEAELRGLAGAVGGKLDVATFLAASAARARALEARSAALAAGAAGAAGLGGPSSSGDMDD